MTPEPPLRGPVGFFFSDPASAKACLAMAHSLTKTTPDVELRLFSNRRHDFESEWPYEITHLSSPPDRSCFAGLQSVFTGTSHPDSSDCFELHALSWANQLGLRSAAFIDHWVNLGLRFELAGTRVLPQRILVPDERAADLAARDGLPPDRLVVFGNPYHAYLANDWRCRRTRQEIRTALGIPEKSRAAILYAPDPISLRQKPDGGGFNEITATQDLLDVIPALGENVAVLIKLHPLQPPLALEPLLKSSPHLLRVDSNRASLPEVIFASDVVVGFFSNLLLEANALKRPVVRYLPGKSAIDPFVHLSFGVKAGTQAELLGALRLVTDGPT